MKITRHEKFVQELRAPMLRAQKAQQTAVCTRKAEEPAVVEFYTDPKLESELKRKFNELFGPADDDNDNFDE